MGASNYPGLALPKPEPRTREKRKQSKADDSHERKVYGLVDQRDGLECVICGRRANPYSLDPLQRLHHHHILQRGRDLGPTETWNVTSVDSICHELIHENRLTVEGNANKVLILVIKADAVVEAFGRRAVPPHVQVVTVDAWGAWLDEHACRMTRLWKD